MSGKLYCGDCLEVLEQKVDRNSVDLIYADPPFSTNRKFESIWEGKKKDEDFGFDDRWSGLDDYIEYMKERWLACYGVLRPTGCIYVHCDPRASHYLKVSLDSIFGRNRFVGEIVWVRSSGRRSDHKWAWTHDVILMYSKTSDFVFNRQCVKNPKRPSSMIVDPSDGLTYQTYDLTGEGRVINGETGKPWHGYDPNSLPGMGRHWATKHEKLDALRARGLIVCRPNWKFPRRRSEIPFDEETWLKEVHDVWTDIPMLNKCANERTNYRMQKPEALLTRIIKASSNRGSLVLDPFCGCGTTVVAAHALGREWIGIDSNPTGIRLVRQRLGVPVDGIEVIGLPVSADELRAMEAYEFQTWVVRELFNGIAGKKGGDMGIDGHTGSRHDPISVKKSDRVGRNVVDNFLAALLRVKKQKGYVVAFSFGKGARVEAARLKRERSMDIELVTIDEALNGSWSYVPTDTAA